MKMRFRSRRFRERILLAGVLALVGCLAGRADPVGPIVRTVEVAAAEGVLQVRDRDGPQYRALGQGRASLTSGSFLKTGEGPADILFPEGTILCLDTHTEVQVGLYENGIWIYQLSGQAYHIVEPGPDSVYVVQTSLYTAMATGTEYRTMINYPVEGAVLVAWGHVGVIVGQWRDPVTGATTPGMTGFVPEGYKIVGPIQEEVITPDPGYRVYRPDQSDKVVRGEKVVPPPDDDWARERRALGRTVRNLRDRHARGLLSDDQFRQKMLMALGFTPRLLRAEPMEREGGLWVGEADYLILSLCIVGTVINEVHVLDVWVGQDKKTRETSTQFVNFTLTGVGVFFLDRTGRVDGTYTIDEGIWRGATVEMRGWIGARSGRIWVSIYSETDAAVYSGSIEVLDIRLVDPHGCDF